jgi:hypothetical protein
MVVAYQGTVQGGQIRMENDPVLPEGTQVIVQVQPEDPAAIQGITGAEILASGLVGLWADRDDIQDSVSFAEELRHKAKRP